MEKKVTCVFTSCGRFNFLNQTVKSFLDCNTYPIEKYVVIDNSQTPGGYEILKSIFTTVENSKLEIIINEENIGQVSSIDKAYELVNTEYIFHCEDDWLFFNQNFIEKSIDVLEFDSSISNINIRIRFDGERGSMHPLTNYQYQTNNGTVYYEYAQNYLGEWHGFSWNPGLRRKSDYEKIKPYKQFLNEQGVGKKYKEMGYKSACLENFYAKHIGGDLGTPKSNM